MTDPRALLTLAAEHDATAARLRADALCAALVYCGGSRRAAALVLEMPERTYLRALAALPAGRLEALAAEHGWPSRVELAAHARSAPRRASL